MKRKLAWVCLLLSLLLLGGAVFCILPRDRITQATCEKIKQGMRENELEAIFGRKSDQDLPPVRGWNNGPYFSPSPVIRAPRILKWNGSRGTITVFMDLHDLARIDTATFEPREPQNIIEKIRDWLGL
jgi:hypothetical protein